MLVWSKTSCLKSAGKEQLITIYAIVNAGGNSIPPDFSRDNGIVLVTFPLIAFSTTGLFIAQPDFFVEAYFFTAKKIITS